MGIVKIRHQEPGNLQDLSTITLGDLRKDSGEEDDYFSELAEVDCEIAMAGDLICSAPYQLYDLPDLKEVVSLETWNSCLTEDERFSLSAYLPDMDEQTFSITMKELLNGENIFFGSPLQALFSRLKGGLYSLQVSRLRDGSRFLQRQLHYRYLRSYHESMTQKLVDMKRAWSDLQPSISIEERIHIWNRRKDNKPVFLVDLNAIPPGKENVSKIPLLKKKRFMNEEVNARVTTQVKAKGVLKRKQIQINPVPNPILQQLPSDSLEPWQQRPKGVLKIKRKNDPLAQERQPAVHLPVEQQPLADLAGVQVSRFFLPQFASTWHEETSSSQLLFPRHKAMGGKAHTCLELPGLMKSQESLNAVGGLKGNSLKAQVKVRMTKDMRLHNTSEMPLKFTESSDHMEHWRGLIDAGFKTPKFHVAVSGVQREGCMLPITYRRKKPYQSLTKVDIHRSSIVATLESMHQLSGKQKPGRTKVKGWNSSNAQKNQGS